MLKLARFLGYEVSGLENIPPPDRGGLVVFYHGVLPMDVVFLSVVISQRLGRVLGGTMHRAVDRTPLIGNILRVRISMSCLRYVLRVLGVRGEE